MFGSFWKSVDKRFAQANFTFWYEQVVKSGIKPMIKVAKTLKRHLYGLLAWFGCMIDNALTEGFNATIQSLKASARGYRNFENFRTVILFFCGKLDLRPDFVRIGSTI
jgi:transposase